MVTILRPRHHKPEQALSDEPNPGSGRPHDDPAGEPGIELDEGEADNKGTGSAPGEGPNPTA